MPGSPRAACPNKPSPILLGDLLFMVNDSGILTCLDAKSGEEVWHARVPDTYLGLAGRRRRTHLLLQRGRTGDGDRCGPRLQSARGEPARRRVHGVAGRSTAACCTCEPERRSTGSKANSTAGPDQGQTRVRPGSDQGRPPFHRRGTRIVRTGRGASVTVAALCRRRWTSGGSRSRRAAACRRPALASTPGMCLVPACRPPLRYRSP